MNFEEYPAKALLADAGITIPKGELASTPEEAGKIAESMGPAIVKAQVPIGKRGKAGGVLTVDGVDGARTAAQRILGMEIGGYRVEHVLVEEQINVKRELYAAVLNDPISRGPLVLFSTLGGMDIEEAAATDPNQVRRACVDIRTGFDRSSGAELTNGFNLGDANRALVDLLLRLYDLYRAHDAELVEINPLALTTEGKLLALDCKFTLDDSAVPRHPELSENSVPEPLTDAERRGRELGLRFIELGGNVGVLANGAGLTMTTMDVIRHYGGHPANFLEIGGEAYTLAQPALELLLSNSSIQSLVINFCGAFARTDVMMEGVAAAWEALQPDLPVFFSVHGTGEEEAVRLLRERLGIEPYPLLDDAVKAAVKAAVGKASSGA